MQPRDGKKRQRRQKTKWRDEIGGFAGITWNRQAADRDNLRRFGRPLSCSELIEALDDERGGKIKFTRQTLKILFSRLTPPSRL